MGRFNAIDLGVEGMFRLTSDRAVLPRKDVSPLEPMVSVPNASIILSSSECRSNRGGGAGRVPLVRAVVLVLFPEGS